MKARRSSVKGASILGEHFPSLALSILPRHLSGRFFLLAGIVAADVAALALIPHGYPFLGPFASFGIVSYAVFLGLGYSEIEQQRQELPFGTGFFFAHLACVLLVSLADAAALHGSGFLTDPMAARVVLRTLLLVGMTLLAFACIPLEAWGGIVRKTRLLWLYAMLAGALAWCLRLPMQSFWDTSRTAPGHLLQILTFLSVKAVLIPVYPSIQVDPEAFVIGTQRFSVVIGELCSGLEGLGLVLAFTTIWLWYFRKESRFPQALLLVPCALVCVWMLNVLRIAALVLIGDAGYGEVAMVGFHSQAGWMAFTAVAFAFSMATRRFAWMRKRSPAVASSGLANPVPVVPVVSFSTANAASTSVPPIASETEPPIAPEIDETGESPATGAYLVPFLAILAASFLSRAASGGFEWLYPLRFLAAAIAIWHYRPLLKQVDWRFGWLAPVTGTVVFLVWIMPVWIPVWLVPSFWAHGREASRLGQSLAELSPTARWCWIAFRVAAATITVPIAEELAFRGYLARRLVDREFDLVPFSAVTVLSIGLSSAAFGLMHGSQWIVGILAGLGYAGVMKWKGRLGDAIVAHTTSNLLLAVWVLSRSDWSQWRR